MKSSPLILAFALSLLVFLPALPAQTPVPQGLQNGGMEEWSAFVLSDSDWLNPEVVDSSIPASWRVMQYTSNGEVVDQPRAIFSRDVTQKHSGESSTRIESGHNIAMLIQRFDLETDTDYILRFWAKGENLPDLAVPVKIWVKKGPSADHGGDFYGSATATELKGDPVTGTFDWTLFEMPFRVDADSGIELSVDVSSAESKFWIDDVAVEPVKP